MRPDGDRSDGVRILIAYDGSEPAEKAVEEVLRRPWPAGTQVRLITVVEKPMPAAGPDRILCGPIIRSAHNSKREETYGRIRNALEKFECRPDVETSYEIREGSPRRSLLEVIREWRPDLVVTGSRGWGGLGSVSLALATHAACHVEIVRGPTSDGQGAGLLP